jgi:hypothetical protein
VSLQPLIFQGALACGLRTLPYTVPAGSFITPYRWMPDAWIAVDDVTGFLRTLYRCRLGYKNEYDLSGGGVNDPNGGQGSIWDVAALRPSQETASPFTPMGALYDLPNPAGPVVIPVSIDNFLDLPAATEPAVWDPNNQPDVIPLATDDNDVKFAARITQNDNTDQRLMVPSTFTPTQGWFASLTVPPLGQCWWPNRVLARSRSFNQGFLGLNNIIDVSVSADGAAFTSAIAFQSDLFNISWLDAPQYSAPNRDDGFFLVADTTDPSAGPLVPNGSPIFYVLADLSAYYELVFSPLDAGVHPNDQGGYGPPWDFTQLFSPQTTTDAEGNQYYIQTDPIDSTVMDVYSFGLTAASGVFEGTFAGFTSAGHFGGGTK